MKAAVLYGKKDIRCTEVPRPEIKNGDEVLVHVKMSGICGSDIPRLVKETAHYFPIVLGHEFSGTVEDLGDRVKDRRRGERIACIPLVPDMNDANSQKGNYSLSRNYSFIGSREQGGWAEYVVMKAANAYPLPDDVSDIEGAFFEPLTVGLHAVNIVGMQVGKYVAITGMGTIGLLALQSVLALGARKVCVFDIDDKKLQIARQLGADLTLNTGSAGFIEQAMDLTEGRGYDIAFETGGVPFTEVLCLKLVAVKGKVMFVGTPHVAVTLAPEEFELINRKEALVSGSWMNYSAPFPGWEWEMARFLFAKGKVKTEPLIDRIIGLEGAPEAMSDLEEPGKVSGKIIFRV